MEKKVNVLIIDDEANKVNLLMQSMKDVEIQKTSETYKINPIKIPDKNNDSEVSLPADMEDILSIIHDKNVHAVILDYKLTSKLCVQYNGIELAEYIKNNFAEFPLFILTSFDEDIYTKELYDTYNIFDFLRVQEEENEFQELIKKIVEQYLVSQKKIYHWQIELNKLLKKQGENAKIDSEILELDAKLEKALGGNYRSIPSKTKRDLLDNTKITKLLEKVDKLLGED